MTAQDREERIRELLPLVRRIARRVHRVTRGADPDDLIGDGSIGLIRAVDGYDPARGTTLETYARRLIVGAMLNGLRKLDPVSERVRRTLRRAEERRYELGQQRGTLPSLSELERTDPALRRARAVVYSQTPLSLDAPLARNDDALADRTHEPAICANAHEKSAALAEAVALLPERQRRILALHYISEVSLHAIGSRLQLSPQRVSQLHLKALVRLRGTVILP